MSTETGKPWTPFRAALLTACARSSIAASAVFFWILGAAMLFTAIAAEDFAPLSPEREGALKPGDTFRECANCPPMVVVPAGSFLMGSPASEKNRNANEDPQHNVTFAKPFAVSKFELTFDEWDVCGKGGGCNEYTGADEGWGRGRQPVINVTWNDAQHYVAWLAKITGKPYRLLTEAEYEYAARAGTTTAYPWGDEIGNNNANCTACGDQGEGHKPLPVDSFAPNQFGLYDMVGNVWAWVGDCAHGNYYGAPNDGSAWIKNSDCEGHEVRGGSWFSMPQSLRSASRSADAPNNRSDVLGVRVGRALER